MELITLAEESNLIIFDEAEAEFWRIVNDFKYVGDDLVFPEESWLEPLRRHTPTLSAAQSSGDEGNGEMKKIMMKLCIIIIKSMNPQMVKMFLAVSSFYLNHPKLATTKTL